MRYQANGADDRSHPVDGLPSLNQGQLRGLSGRHEGTRLPFTKTAPAHRPVCKRRDGNPQEQAKIPDPPGTRRHKRVTLFQSPLPEHKTHPHRPREQKGDEEFSRLPAVSRSKGEGNDEEQGCGEHDGASGQVEAFPFFRDRMCQGIWRGIAGRKRARYEDVRDGRERDGEQGDEAEIPTPGGHLTGGGDKAEERGEH